MLSTAFLLAAITLGLLSFAWPTQLAIELLAAVSACLAAVFAALQANAQGRYLWLGAFLVMAALLNPVVPFPLTRVASLLVLALSLVALVSWQALLRRTASPSVAPILHP